MMMETTHSVQLEQFEAGLAMGLDPDSQAMGEEGNAGDTQRTTTLRSRWLHRRCSICGHSFRLGDEVVVRTGIGALHDMTGLRCAGGKNADPPDPAIKRLFFEGLDQAWPMPEGVKIARLEGDHYLLASPHKGHARAACRVCGHTFRPGDHVVICPCSPEVPKCIAAVHRDTLNQLHCWDEWVKARTGDTCLGMS